MAATSFGVRLRRARRDKKLTQTALAKALGVSQSYVAQLESGEAHPAAALAARIKDLLGITAKPAAGRSNFAAFEEPSSIFGTRWLRRPRGGIHRVRLPILGVPLPGDDERLLIDDEPHGEVMSPPQLEDVPGAKALYVRGRSMEPRYYPGEVIYLSPARAPNPGDFVLAVVREPPFATNIGYIRQYRGEDSDQVLLASLNPPLTLNLPKESVVRLLTVVGSGLL